MKKLFFKALAAVALWFAAMPAMAQMPQVPALPTDTNVVVGKLDNGLTYYIRHNESPKGQADFFIAQKVGSALEEESQRGLAHFLEHMCFNGTENFPGNSLIDWLETVGVKFGHNLNAYTSIDETVYNISSVPVARKGVQDSCLLILHDWADGLLLDPEEINKERGVIHQEWRRSMTGQMRILENLLPVMYPNNRYGKRLPIGTMEVVDNFAPQTLRDYYETWYRPDNQAIIVVGDIDPKYIESKIKEIFSPIKMPENPKVREYFAVEDTPGTIWAIGKDKEMTNQVAMLMFKQKEKLVPEELMNTQVYYIVHYMTSLIEDMLNERLNEISKAPDAPFAFASVEIGDFFLSKTKDAFMVEVVGKGDDITPAIQAVYREILRALRGGFTVSEIERAQAKYLANIEEQYNSRNKVDNTRYAREYAKNFTNGDPIPGIETEYELIKQLAPMLSNAQSVNALLPEMIANDNRVFLVMVPDKEGVVVPTEEGLSSTLAAVDKEDIEAYKEETKAEPLIPNLPKAVKPKTVKKLAQFDATELTFPNGVKVIYKPTKFKDGEIIFNADAAGGTSVIPDADAASVVFLPYATSVHGLGDYTNSDLEKYLSGKQTSFDFSFDASSRSLEGKTTPKNLQTLMELIYSTFTGFNITADEFAGTQNKYKGVLANQEANPQFIFQRNLTKSLYKSPKSQVISTEAIDQAKLSTTLDIVKRMLAAPSDYTFVFVGDLDPETFTQLASQYIGTLPKAAAKASVKYTPDAAVELALGTSENNFTTKMETPQTWVFIGANANIPYNTKNRLLSSVAAQILSNRLLKKIREEMGAVYSIGAGGQLSRLATQNAVLQIPFPMKPELKEQVLTEINNMLQAMTQDVTADELNPIKEYMAKNYKSGLEENDTWAGTISAIQLNGVDTFNGQLEAINALTVDDVMNYMKELLAQKNIHTVLLEAAE